MSKEDWPFNVVREAERRAEKAEDDLDREKRYHQKLTIPQRDAAIARADAAEAALEEMTDRASCISAEANRFLRERDAARALADELGRMLNESCWAIDHTCTQCGERQPAHTPRCPTYLALAKWEASHAPNELPTAPNLGVDEASK